jgi:hypothetical protein
MDRKKMLCALAGAVALSCVVLFATAGSLMANTPLYTVRMEQASNKMNFLPTAVNEFTYTAEKGYTLEYGFLNCCIDGATPRVDTTGTCWGYTCTPSCVGYTCSGWTCFKSCEQWTCYGITCDISCGYFTCQVPETCPHTCPLSCSGTCVTCPGQGWTCDDTSCQETCSTCSETCPDTCWETCDGPTCAYTCERTCHYTCEKPCVP